MTVLTTPREVVEQYAALDITDGAQFAAEGARIVCHTEIVYASTVYDIVASFYCAADAINTASGQMSLDLVRMLAAGELHSTQSELPDAAEAITTARNALARAQAHADALGTALRDAQNAIAHIATKG